MSTQLTIAAVGAGRMGRGIAITFAAAGYPVRLIDLKPRSSAEFDSLRIAASQEIEQTLSMLADAGLYARSIVADIAARISYYPHSLCAESLTGADIIFEGVPETLAAKHAAFELISTCADTDAIVASTTSTILSDTLQEFVSPPQRFLNAHWLNPAFIVPLVELSPGKETDPEVTRRLKDVLESVGKVPVVCAVSPGYIVPRIQALAMNEAARMVEEGVASVEDIDNATRYGFGFRFAILGLLEFIDWGGGDILYHASRYMAEATGDARYVAPEIIETNMQEGRLGLKTQQGFLDYSGMDVPAYQQQRLDSFVAMLRHIQKLPVVAQLTESATPIDVVKHYLNAMESRDIECARTYLADDFVMTFPGGARFTDLHDLVDWAKNRYRSIGKTYERFDQCVDRDEIIIYCYGTLSGVWLDDTEFSGVRFIDRFSVADGLLVSQHVWNDLAESVD